MNKSIIKTGAFVLFAVSMLTPRAVFGLQYAAEMSMWSILLLVIGATIAAGIVLAGFLVISSKREKK